MTDAPYKSTGIEISMRTNAFSRNITDVTPAGETVDDIDATHQGTSVVAVYDPGPIKEGGELEFGVHGDPSQSVPVGVKDTFIISYPAAAGNTDVSFDGYIKGEDPDAPHRENITNTITVQVNTEKTRS